MRQDNGQWYIVSTQSGKEHEIKLFIDNRIKSSGMEDIIFETFICEEETPVMRNGEPTGKTKMKNLYPRYLFVRMKMTDEAWYLIRNTPGVTGFIGSSGKGTKPTPVSPDEMDQVLKLGGRYNAAVVSEYVEGARIRFIKGLYVNNEGVITYADQESKTLLATVELGKFTATTTSPIPFSEVEVLK